MVVDWKKPSEALFWWSAKERHKIFTKKAAGDAGPWTDDPLLGRLRTCCPYRQADKHSIQMRLLSAPLVAAEERETAAEVVALARRNCRLELWPELMAAYARGGVEGWFKRSREISREGVPVRTGSYISCLPPDMDLRAAYAVSKAFGERDWRDARELADRLNGQPGVGKFMAWQHALDWGICLGQGVGWRRWTNCDPILGPGALKGAALLGAKDKRGALILVERLALDAPERGPNDLLGWTMTRADVEHWLCEFQKLVRAAVGGHAKPYKAGS